MRLSGWCSGPVGSRLQHAHCRADVCTCDCHENGLVDTDSVWNALGSEAPTWENEGGPEGAPTPESPGLTTATTRPNRGAKADA